MSDERSVERVPLAQPFGRQVRRPGTVWGTLLSAVLHVAVIALLVWAGRRHFLAPDGGPGDPRLGRGGGGGGGGVRGLVLFTQVAMGQPPTPPAAPVVQPPLTVPQQVQPLPQTAPAAVATPVPATGDGAGQGTGAGPGSGTGTGGGVGGGTGSGVGNDSGPGGGGGGRLIEPQAQGMIIPPPGAPGSVKGIQYRVTFSITERGEVADVKIEPEMRDRGYRNEFLDRLRRYTFTPGYVDGHAVAAQTVLVITIH